VSSRVFICFTIFTSYEERTKFIALIGLGYVGLPLAVEFAKYFPVTGFDIKKDRIKELLGRSRFHARSGRQKSEISSWKRALF